MGGAIPGVFVSSTCYDLGQVRSDLLDFIKSMGLEPFLSEYPSFPLDPSVAAVENCIANVEKFADVFVLVVGGRYGSQMPDSARSVTNAEYLAARRMGVPVYAFVLRSVLDSLPLWKDNPTSNFSRVVDSTKVFEFVEQLYEAGGVWVCAFDRAQQISETLRVQLAILTKELLELRSKVVARPISQTLASLGPPALRLAIEQPREWEMRLVHAVLSEELERLRPGRFDLAYGTDATKVSTVDDRALLEMVQPTTRRLFGFIETVQRIVEVALPAAIGSDNTPATADDLVFVARRFASAYGDTLELAIQLRHLRVECENPEARTLIAEWLEMGESFLASIETYVDTLGVALRDILSKPEPPPGTQTPIKLTIVVPDDDRAAAAIDALLAKYAEARGVTLS